MSQNGKNKTFRFELEGPHGRRGSKKEDADLPLWGEGYGREEVNRRDVLKLNGKETWFEQTLFD